MTDLCSREWCNEFRIPTVSEYCGLKLRNEALPVDAKPSVSQSFMVFVRTFSVGNQKFSAFNLSAGSVGWSTFSFRVFS